MLICFIRYYCVYADLFRLSYNGRLTAYGKTYQNSVDNDWGKMPLEFAAKHSSFKPSSDKGKKGGGGGNRKNFKRNWDLALATPETLEVGQWSSVKDDGLKSCIAEVADNETLSPNLKLPYDTAEMSTKMFNYAKKMKIGAVSGMDVDLYLSWKWFLRSSMTVLSSSPWKVYWEVTLKRKDPVVK